MVASPAHAQQAAPDAKAIEEAKKHFAKAKELYDKGDKQGAVEEFKEAYKLSKNALLLYNIAYVYDELGDKPLALHFYQKFLEDAPEGEKTHDNRVLAAQRVTVLQKEIADAEAAAGGGGGEQGGGGGEQGGGGGEQGGGGGGEVAIKEFDHTVLDEAPPAKPLDVTAKIPADSKWRLTLYYRTAGEDEFHTVRMKQRYDEIVGRIPADAMNGGSVQYYIEVKDENGKLVASSGSASSPNIVYLDAGAKPHYYADLSENGSGDMDGGGDGDGNGTRPSGPVDTKLTTMDYVRWGTTGGAAVLITTSVVLYFIAASRASDLETEAFNSNHPAGGVCAGVGGDPPCGFYGSYQRGLQDNGKNLELWTNVTFFVGVGAALAAGGLWYWEIKHHKPAKIEKAPAAADEEEEASNRLFVAPVVGDGVIGGAAVYRF